MEKTIVLASANEGKAREFRAILEPLGFIIVLQSELGVKSPEETGKSFIENAILKARYAAEKTGMWALADDSGLSVDALNGAPGIYSARFSGGDDKSNNLKLLDLMKDVPSDKRSARYYCALCLVRHKDDPVPLTVLSSWEGAIGYKEIGSGGFGYDPLFMVTGRQCTAAQLPPQIKNLISHRGRALAALTYKLEHNLS
ncbi:MAG: RdgB/HAM1 family non-canonical purine NTP pyrophosphatase [Succinivibrio sp.]|nr:RdgB/HAM1 family non-canonical purine NTP pyrophosphatase [Succinivibrio sp.]